MFIHSVYINLSNKIDVSNLDIQYIDVDEALEDLSVVEWEESPRKRSWLGA